MYTQLLAPTSNPWIMHWSRPPQKQLLINADHGAPNDGMSTKVGEDPMSRNHGSQSEMVTQYPMYFLKKHY